MGTSPRADVMGNSDACSALSEPLSTDLPLYRDRENPQMPMPLPNLTIEYKSKNTGLRHPGLYGTWKIKLSPLYLGELRRNNPRFVPRDGACGNMAMGTIPVI